jgi:protein-tyrosine phosphatase
MILGMLYAVARLLGGRLNHDSKTTLPHGATDCDMDRVSGQNGVLSFERYGGRRGFLRHLSARAETLVGVHRPLQRLDWGKIDRFVFVCAGNICRSPYAAQRARAAGADAVSFGLQASDGATADPAAMRNALQRGLDLDAHRSVRLEISRLRPADLVLLFEPRQLQSFLRLEGARQAHVSLVGLWSAPARPHLTDPYGRSDRYFQECFALIDSSVRALLAHRPR